jgi:hypothetical protein
MVRHAIQFKVPRDILRLIRRWPTWSQRLWRCRGIWPTAICTISVILVLGLTLPAAAQLNRAWVSSHGSDIPTCGAVASPCRSLQYVHDRIIAPGGEIDVLDAATYGPLTITKAVSIANDQAGTASVLQAASEGNAITVVAGPNDAIHLRGLNIDGAGLAADGIQFRSGNSLDVVRCIVRHFRSAGIELKPNTPSSVSITDTIASDNGFAGIYAGPFAGMNGTIKGLVANNNSVGIFVNGAYAPASAVVFMVAADSVAANNHSAGFATSSTDGQSIPTLALSGATAGGNAHYGILADAHSEILLWRSTIAGSPVGVAKNGTGMIRTLDKSNLSADLAVPAGGNAVVSAVSSSSQVSSFNGGNPAAAPGIGHILSSPPAPAAAAVPALTQPGGSSGQLQYNNNGTFGGVPVFTWDGTNLKINAPIQGSFGSGTNNIAFGNGAGAGVTTGSNNTAIGWGAEGSNAAVTGNYNSAFGPDSLSSVTTGYENVAVGALDLESCTTCAENVAVGDDALQYNVSGQFNVAVGDAALGHFTGNTATAVGYGAMQSISNTAQLNAAFGFNTMSSASLSGSNDTGIGAEALSADTTGYYNTALGANAGNTITTGSQNTCIGEGACNGITTGNDDVVIGYGIPALSSSLTNAIVLGTNSAVRLDYNATASGVWTFAAPIVTPSSVYASLPSCTSTIKGARSMITDGSWTPTFSAAAVGGGALMTPVYCDGTTWRYG